MSQQGRLLTEDAQQHFFKIAYPDAVFSSFIDYYFDILISLILRKHPGS